MMLPTLLLLAPSLLATSPLSSGEAPAPVLEQDSPEQSSTLRFTAAEGIRLLKTMTWKHELNLDEMGTTRSGSELMRENLGGWMSSTLIKVYVDEYLSVADGRPQQVRRLIRNTTGHGKLNLSGDRGRIEERASFKSPMKGLTLLLTWIEEEGEYARLYDVIDHEEELLQEVTGDVDFIYMLPQGEVAEGDTWELDMDDMRLLLAPGGNLASKPTEEGAFPRTMEVGVGGDFADLLGKRISGNATATYGGELVVDGRRLGVIDLALNVATKRDRTGVYRSGMEQGERAEASQLKHVNVVYTLVGTGQLLWDLDAGHYDSFELEGHEAFRTEVVKMRSEGGELVEVSQVVAFSGSLTLEYEQRLMRTAAERAAAEAAEADQASGGQ